MNEHLEVRAAFSSGHQAHKGSPLMVSSGVVQQSICVITHLVTAPTQVKPNPKSSPQQVEEPCSQVSVIP